MSTHTPNLNLEKPSGNERPDIDVINRNMDILDDKIGAVGDEDLQSQISSKVRLNNLVDGFLRYYTSGGNQYVQLYWVVTSTLSYFIQFNLTAATGGVYKVDNGTTSLIKSL